MLLEFLILRLESLFVLALELLLVTLSYCWSWFWLHQSQQALYYLTVIAFGACAIPLLIIFQATNWSRKTFLLPGYLIWFLLSSRLSGHHLDTASDRDLKLIGQSADIAFCHPKCTSIRYCVMYLNYGWMLSEYFNKVRYCSWLWTQDVFWTCTDLVLNEFLLLCRSLLVLTHCSRGWYLLHIFVITTPF